MNKKIFFLTLLLYISATLSMESDKKSTPKDSSKQYLIAVTQALMSLIRINSAHVSSERKKTDRQILGELAKKNSGNGPVGTFFLLATENTPISLEELDLSMREQSNGDAPPLLTKPYHEMTEDELIAFEATWCEDISK